MVGKASRHLQPVLQLHRELRPQGTSVFSVLPSQKEAGRCQPHKNVTFENLQELGFKKLLR